MRRCADEPLVVRGGPGWSGVVGAAIVVASVSGPGAVLEVQVALLPALGC